MEDLAYPVGRFVPSPDHSPEARSRRLEAIADLPRDLERAVDGLGDAQLDTPYRPGGWTVRQVVHHLADSHANAVIRIRLALTEESPTVRPYDQDAWAGLPDARTEDIGPSLDVLRGLHARWVALLGSVPGDAFSRIAVHPEVGPVSIDWFLDQYAWHGRHHTAQILAVRERLGW